ncbi:hypothetical protein VE02_00043 [Pseudogymnoascus sp. 03VT05]|nr:hypothetical protein VE02_00043 [Pseudogymnoascus sp. 03VT05]
MDYGTIDKTYHLIDDVECRAFLRSQAPSPPPPQDTPNATQIQTPAPPPMLTPPPYTAAPPPGPSFAAESSTSPRQPEPRASSLYKQEDPTQCRVVEDVVEKMRKQIVRELRSMEKRVIAKIEEQGRTLEEGLGEQLEEAVEEGRRKGGDGWEVWALVLLLLGMFYLTKN